jgi:hypothetical protein
MLQYALRSLTLFKGGLESRIVIRSPLSNTPHRAFSVRVEPQITVIPEDESPSVSSVISNLHQAVSFEQTCSPVVQFIAGLEGPLRLSGTALLLPPLLTACLPAAAIGGVTSFGTSLVADPSRIEEIF